MSERRFEDLTMKEQCDLFDEDPAAHAAAVDRAATRALNEEAVAVLREFLPRCLRRR